MFLSSIMALYEAKYSLQVNLIGISNVFHLPSQQKFFTSVLYYRLDGEGSLEKFFDQLSLLLLINSN
jgi:hypothetical protein